MYRIDYDYVFELVRYSIGQYKYFKIKDIPSVLRGYVSLYYDIKNDVYSISGFGRFDGIWVHIVLVIDYKTNTQKRYINGVLYKNKPGQ